MSKRFIDRSQHYGNVKKHMQVWDTLFNVDRDISSILSNHEFRIAELEKENGETV